ncbi:MAG: hypothetical protein AAF529_13005 [Pseudomonadota bacterium]
MNIERLKTAEMVFLERYPGGFGSEEMQQVAKKFRLDRMTASAHETLAKDKFRMQGQVLDDIVKLVTRSGMVSLFEKPKFRDYVNGLNRDDREYLAAGFKELLHFKNQARGFNKVLDVLTEGKLAKWSLMTIIPFTMQPEVEVFVKPTTTKRIISYLELEGLEYKPRPSWEFYATYRERIAEMKGLVDASLTSNNAAFTGFLMVTLDSGGQR